MRDMAVQEVTSISGPVSAVSPTPTPTSIPLISLEWAFQQKNALLCVRYLNTVLLYHVSSSLQL